MLHLYMWLRDGFSYLRNQRGIETLEWILIAGVVTGVAITIYGFLEGNLGNTVNNITTTIDSAAQ